MSDGHENGEAPGQPLLSPDNFPPPSSTVEIEFGAHSLPGHGHAVNSDHYHILRLGRHQETILTNLSGALCERFDEQGYAMVVADGSNEAASSLALFTLIHLVRCFGEWKLRIDAAVADDIMQRTERFYRHVDLTLASQEPEGRDSRLETTLTAAFGAGDDLFFAHVGHSRAYLCRKGSLTRLTRDHTVGRSNSIGVPAGTLPDINAAARDLQQLLTQTIGGSVGTGPKVDLERFHLDDGDVVLVCTNGLTNMVDEPTIADVLMSTRSPQEQSQVLVGLAIDAGGTDNATALVARYHIPATP